MGKIRQGHEFSSKAGFTGSAKDVVLVKGYSRGGPTRRRVVDREPTVDNLPTVEGRPKIDPGRGPSLSAALGVTAPPKGAPMLMHITRGLK